MSAAAISDVVMGIDDARRLTERIRVTAHNAREAVDKLQRLVDEARTGNAHMALGYPSWTAYLADTLGDEPLRLPRDQRREVVQMLAGEGLSTRAIAPIVGADNKTVWNDIQAAPVEISTPAPSPTPAPTIATNEGVVIAEQRHVDLPPFDPTTGEVLDEEPQPTKVTGLDGKTYSRPVATAPRRPPLTDTFTRVSIDLAKKVESLVRLTEDDRFPQNAEKAATANRSDLLRAIDALQRVVDRLDNRA